VPDGFIAQEFQEWMRLVVVPKCQYFASRFAQSKTEKCYKRLQADLDWEEDDGPCYMLAMDKDKRHTMTDMVHYRQCRNGTGRGELRDRRELDKHTEGWIQLTSKQIVPAGPKQCDTIQQPVECTVSQIKRAARAQLPLAGQKSGMQLVSAVVEGAKSVSVANVKAYWQHALKAIRVWSSRECESHSFVLSRNKRSKPYTFNGTHGGIVQRELRA